MSDHTPETITIQLTKGYTTVIDVIDADLCKYKWCAARVDKGGYAMRGINRKELHTRIVMHRLIMSRMINRDLQSHEFVDHIDGNPLNNTRANLRLTDNSGNLRNSRRRKDNTSGYKCVYPEKRGNRVRWVAHIFLNKKQVKLGRFKTPEEAFEAYKKAALEHYGEFARFE